ncbi:hypothetical protein Tco_1321251 [Tanacetum coccineum]
MSPPSSHEPEIQASRSSEESEQLRNLMDIVPRLESRESWIRCFHLKQSENDSLLHPEKSKDSREACKKNKNRRKPKSKPTPTKILHFEEPDESQVNTGSTLSAQVNTVEVNTAELNAVSTPSAQFNTS